MPNFYNHFQDKRGYTLLYLPNANVKRRFFEGATASYDAAWIEIKCLVYIPYDT